MVLWIDAEHSQRPNDQRAELIRVDKTSKKILVQFLGDGEYRELSLKSICGFELQDGVVIQFSKRTFTVIQ